MISRKIESESYNKKMPKAHMNTALPNRHKESKTLYIELDAHRHHINIEARKVSQFIESITCFLKMFKVTALVEFRNKDTPREKVEEALKMRDDTLERKHKINFDRTLLYGYELPSFFPFQMLTIVFYERDTQSMMMMRKCKFNLTT